MAFPIHLRYEDQAEPVTVPLFPDAERSRTWWQTLAYVNKNLAPSKRSFTLYDEHFVIRYREGQPHQGDLLFLLEALRHGFSPCAPVVQRRAA